MFKSPLTAEIPLHDLFSNDFRYWRAVMHETTPWIHLTLTTCFEDGSRVQYVQLDSVHSFELVTHQLQPNQQISDVQIAVPARMNKQGRWTLEPLQQLQEGELEQLSVYVYRMQSGATYVDGYVGDAGEDAVANLRTIYVAPPSAHGLARGVYANPSSL